MKIEPGKWYRTREGQIVRCDGLEDKEWAQGTFMSGPMLGIHTIWLRTGYYNVDDLCSDKDLVRELTPAERAAVEGT